MQPRHGEKPRVSAQRVGLACGEFRAMAKGVAVVATLGVGALVAFQPPVNSQLARHTSVIGAAFVSTAISALFLGVIFFGSGRAGELEGLGRVPIAYLSGGLIGAALVSVSLVTVRSLGAGGVVAATVCTQLIVSAVLDSAGVLGLHRVGLSAPRAIGFGLLIVGTALVTLQE